MSKISVTQRMDRGYIMFSRGEGAEFRSFSIDNKADALSVIEDLMDFFAIEQNWDDNFLDENGAPL